MVGLELIEGEELGKYAMVGDVDMVGLIDGAADGTLDGSYDGK